jgi:hypothetical protein
MARYARERERERERRQVHTLELAGVDNGGLLGVVDGAGSGAGGLESPNDLHGLLVGNLAEDDVAAIEPSGLDGGDEELRTVAARVIVLATNNFSAAIRV